MRLDQGQAGVHTELEVTPAMIEAGRSELFEAFRLGGDYADLVEAIFVAMAFASPALRPLLPQAKLGPTERH